MSEAEKVIDQDRDKPVLSVAIWWSRDHSSFIAAAQNLPGVIGVGKTFAAAAAHLEAELLKKPTIELEFPT